MVIAPTYNFCCRSCEKDVEPTSVLPLKIYICCILMQFSGKLVCLLSLCLVTLGEIGGRFSHPACLVLCRASPDMSAMVADLLCTCGEAVKIKTGNWPNGHHAHISGLKLPWLGLVCWVVQDIFCSSN